VRFFLTKKRETCIILRRNRTMRRITSEVFYDVCSLFKGCLTGR